jgi:predicted nucleic acid-binding protein
VILADTSIWVDHFRASNHQMQSLLNRGKVAMHPCVVAEIALGSLKDRQQKLAAMDSLRKVKVAQMREVRHMIEAHTLYSKGIGLTDAHLIASCLLTPGTQLWTRDVAMMKAAAGFGILANPTMAGKPIP